MHKVDLPFVPGQIVGIKFMTEAGIVDEVVINAFDTYYKLVTCYEPFRKIGSFEANDLYELEGDDGWV